MIDVGVKKPILMLADGGRAKKERGYTTKMFQGFIALLASSPSQYKNFSLTKGNICHGDSYGAVGQHPNRFSDLDSSLLVFALFPGFFRHCIFPSYFEPIPQSRLKLHEFTR